MLLKSVIPPVGFTLVYEGLRQDGDMRWSHFDQRWTLVYSENSTITISQGVVNKSRKAEGGGMLQVRMKVTDSYPGWVGRLIDRGIKALHRPVAFGRTEWIFKKDEEAIKVVEGCGTSITSKIESPTPKQCEIAKELEEVGVAVIVLPISLHSLEMVINSPKGRKA